MRTRMLIAVVVLSMAALAACGDDDGGSGSTETTTADSDVVTLTADLEGGAAEVPAAGDPDGTGDATVTVDEAKGEICYEITVENISPPVAAHIHKGAAGTAGPVVITFDPAKIGQDEDCLTGQKAEDVKAIIATPGDFYVNVHTADFQGGAVRGQLATT